MPTTIPPTTARTRTRATGSISTSRETTMSGVVMDQVDNTDRVDAGLLENCPHPAYVTVKGGLTKTTPIKFESVRVDVSICMPCLPTDAAIEETYTHISGTVDDLINRELGVALGIQTGATDQLPVI